MIYGKRGEEGRREWRGGKEKEIKERRVKMKMREHDEERLFTYLNRGSA